MSRSQKKTGRLDDPEQPDSRSLLTVAALCAAMVGCGTHPSPSARLANDGAVRETWDAVYLQASHIGYLHVTEQTKSDASPPTIESTAEMKMSMKRDGQEISLEASRKCIETVEGKLVSFREEQRLGPTPTVTTGQVEDGKLVVKTTSADRTDTRQIDLPDDVGGPFAPEHSLQRKPMVPGEKRTVRFFEPMLGALASETLEARDYEQTKLPSGTQELLRIESTLATEGQKRPTRSLRWTDREGETLKTEKSGMQQVTYRTTKEEATRSDDEPSFDLMRGTIVKLAEPMTDAHQTRVVRYRVELTDGDPTEVFSVGPTQHVKATGPHTAEVTVTSMAPQSPSCEGSASSASDDERNPSSIVQSDDPRIVEMAREAAGGQTSEGEVAVALERHVAEKMTAKRNYSTAFATASDVCRTLEGDCTEHAVLLTALARATGIPARVAIGLVYSPADQGFAYHMWTEMLLDGCWTPLDATLGQGRVSADHLKLTDSALSDSSGFASFLPLAEVLGQLKIEVVDAQ
jgi:transglutaminase-like putative cysteine protease